MYISEDNKKYIDTKTAKDRGLAVISAGYLVTDVCDIMLTEPSGMDNYLLLFIKRGFAILRQAGKEIMLHKNNLAIFYPHEPRDCDFISDTVTEAYWVHFSGTQAEELLSTLELDDIKLTCPSGDTVSPLIKQMVSELQEPKVFSDEYLCGLLLQALSRTAQNYSLLNPIIGIDEVIARFSKEYMKDISVAEYAKRCGISQSHFMRLFKEKMGVSPHDHRLKLRIENAKKMLVDTKCTVSSIGQQVGFKNPYHFSNYFKQLTGLAPQKYREQAEEKKNRT